MLGRWLHLAREGGHNLGQSTSTEALHGGGWVGWPTWSRF
jgi:hypothetical protein